MTLSDDVQKGMVAGLFGLIGTLIPAALAWSRDRDVASTRARRLDEATKRITFWEQWLKLSSTADPADLTCTQRVLKELKVLGEIIESESLLAQSQVLGQQRTSSEYERLVGSVPFWRKLLLLYKPQRALAWFPRLFFYIGLFLAAVFPFSLVDPTNKDFTPKDFIVAELFMLVWMAIFRSLSQWLEHPHASALPTAAAPSLPKT
jgi:hypothetical protein